MKKFIKEYWELLLTLIVIVGTIMFMCCSCKASDHLRESTQMVQKDTVYLSTVTHDTIKTVEVVRDSVDRVVEITTYIDSNGVIHEKEIERLTRYINHNAEVYESTTRLLQERIAKLKEQLREKEEIKVVEKKVYVWWPCWVVLGIGAFLGLWWLFEHAINNLAKKEGEQ